MKKILLIFIIFVFAGCSYGKIAKKNNDLMLTLKPGQSKEDVLKVMGYPSKSEKYTLASRDTDILFYRTSSFASGGWDSDDYFTPVIFEDGKLVGWGQDLYDQKMMSSSR